MPLSLLQVDAFTDMPFRGNPAGVCPPTDAPLPDERMQAIAREMNLSETAFLEHRGETAFGLRWFTPACEVDLCGHATLAAAHVLWTEGLAPAGHPLTFHTQSGALLATWQADGPIWMDFPAEPATACDAPDGLADALGAEAAWTGRNRMDLLVLLESEAAVRHLRPDLLRLGTIEARGVIVTAAAGEADAPYDFVSRFFAPQAGVPEDPVTGSAHCALAPFWAKRMGRARLTGYQASARGGTVDVEDDGERVRLGGRAVTVLRAELLA